MKARITLLMIFVIGIFHSSISRSGEKDVDVEMVVALVNVWVRATDSNGMPVKGLTAADFEISEDGKPVSIDCLEEIDNEKNQAGQAPTAVPASGQRFVLYLDLLNTTSSDYLFIKPRITEFLSQIDSRKSEVMVAALMPSGKLRLVSPYTSYIPQVEQLVDQAKGNTELSQEALNNERDLQLILDQLVEEAPILSIGELAETSMNIPRDKNTQTLRNAMNLVRTITTTERNRAELTMSALGSLGVYLAKKGEDSHTVVLYVSGGVNTDPGRHYHEIMEQAIQKKGIQMDSQVYAIRVGKAPSEVFDIQSLVRNTVGILNRLNVTLYSVSTRGLPTSTNAAIARAALDSESFKIATDYQGSLVQMADETGGISFVNSSNYAHGFVDVWNDLQHSYLLCYYKPEHGERKFHEIRLKSKKPGVNLRYRSGYID